jgi:uncharacterized membrane protein
MRKKILLTTLLIILTIQASSFNASIESIKQEAETESPAEFQINIENKGTTEETYSLSLLSPKSSWFSYPNRITTQPNTVQTKKLTIEPDKEAVQSRYKFDLRIRELSTNTVKQVTGYFNVKQPYIINIVSLSQNKEKINPGETFNTQIEIQNLDSQTLSTYEIKAQYKNQTQTRTGTPILSKGTRRYNYTFQAHPNATPSTENINYTITAKNKTQNTANQKITIKTVKNLQKTSQTENQLITVQKTVKATNKGNTPQNTTLETQIPSYLSSITQTTPEPTQTTQKNGKTIYKWNKTLQPGESLSASHKTKYWVLILALTLIALGITAIKLLNNDIQITKETSKEGEKVKIEIEIENTGQKTFEKLHLEEFIPDIATVDETFDMNTPKIRKTNEGTKLNWEIQDLTPGDQRIIQYQIKPKVQVEGEVTLQKATLKNNEGETIRETKETKTEFNPDTT